MLAPDILITLNTTNFKAGCPTRGHICKFYVMYTITQ